MTSPSERLRILQKTGLLFMDHRGISHFCLPCLDSRAARPRPSSLPHLPLHNDDDGDTVSGEHQHHGFGLPDPFRKFSSSVAAANIDRRPIAAVIITTITTALNNPLDPRRSLSPTLDHVRILLGLLLPLCLFRRAMEVWDRHGRGVIPVLDSPAPFGHHRHEHGRPHAIVIPGSRMGSVSGMAHGRVCPNIPSPPTRLPRPSALSLASPAKHAFPPLVFSRHAPPPHSSPFSPLPCAYALPLPLSTKGASHTSRQLEVFPALMRTNL
ncbi:hypothetical protein K443DRAFT_15417 [Laccaria amethystina LaAM-08-1]|uniref:Uncharacterized protein n=1 Tax=Laccaria amethystina LaAM-08-1 TaxID=1095629 RepID=A0A0C9WQY8_9AGAR|nr:hypothetical protein K443DRAFT_15417 [Laccaria amethystina LaAM-08-1]